MQEAGPARLSTGQWKIKRRSRAVFLVGRVGLFTKESYTKSEAMRRWFCIKWPVLKLEKKIVRPQTSLICIKADLLGNYIGVYILYFWSWGHGYTKVYSSLYNSLKICTCLKFSIVKKKKPSGVKNQPAKQETLVRFQGKIPWRRDRLPTPVFLGFLSGSDSKESTHNVRHLGSITELRRSPGGGHDNPLQCSCLENPHGQRSTAGYSPWGHKELDITEWISIVQKKKKGKD